MHKNQPKLMFHVLFDKSALFKFLLEMNHIMVNGRLPEVSYRTSNLLFDM